MMATTRHVNVGGSTTWARRKGLDERRRCGGRGFNHEGMCFTDVYIDEASDGMGAGTVVLIVHGCVGGGQWAS
jgi:hypothetical protein